MHEDGADDGRTTHRRYLDRMGPVLDYVRTHPREELDIDSLARLAHFSPYHFHRVFTAVMGETVGLFVRRTRLERAIQLMKFAPGRGLGRVALEAGFGSASDFSRTFQRHYGMAPSRWDRRSPLVFRKNREDTDREKPYDLQEMIAADQGPPPVASLEVVEARTLAYVRIREPFHAGALEAGYEQLRQWLARRGLPEAEGALWGTSWDDVEITPPEQIRYDFACPVPEGTEPGDGAGVRDSPALRIVTAHARGNLARVARVWDHLYSDWLPASRWEPDHHPAFERYHAWPERLDHDDWDLDCCIPLIGLRPV